MGKIIDSPETLVAYLDIVGYRTAISNSPANKSVYYKAIDEAISGFQAIFTQSNYYDLAVTIKEHISLDVFSDSVIIVFDQYSLLKIKREGSKITPEMLLDIFSYLISFLTHYCLIEIKHLFRGTIVKGQYYHREFDSLKGNNFVFSKALCEAYTNAETIADTPRVLVHDTVLQAIENVSGLICNNATPQNSLLIDVDGLYYLNVYKCFLYNSKAAFSTSKCLACILREGLVANNDPPDYRNRRKWVWFVKYHNEMMNKLSAFSRMFPDLDYRDFETQSDSLIVEVK